MTNFLFVDIERYFYWKLENEQSSTLLAAFQNNNKLSPKADKDYFHRKATRKFKRTINRILSCIKSLGETQWWKSWVVYLTSAKVLQPNSIKSTKDTTPIHQSKISMTLVSPMEVVQETTTSTLKKSLQLTKIHLPYQKNCHKKPYVEKHI